MESISVTESSSSSARQIAKKDITIVYADILSHPGYIVHQCNCKTSRGRTLRAAGLSAHIFKVIPEADIYSNERTYQRVPGNICIREKVVNLFGQRCPGKVTARETAAQRLAWFQKGLDELENFLKQEAEACSGMVDMLPPVAFPYKIGCGLAGGNWPDYWSCIQQFAARVPHPVMIYRFDE